MQSDTGGANRNETVGAAVAHAGGMLVRRGVMFLLAHSLFLALAVSLFAAD